MEENYPRPKLCKILKNATLALRNSVSYCQGMNYVGGFFLNIYENEDKTFQYYFATIDNTMSEIFNESFKKL